MRFLTTCRSFAICNFSKAPLSRAQPSSRRYMSLMSSSMKDFLEFERSMKAKKEAPGGPESTQNNIASKNKVDVSKVSFDPPIEPEEEDCCGMDCANCVWVVYQEQLEEYEARILNHRHVQYDPPTRKFSIEYVDSSYRPGERSSSAGIGKKNIFFPTNLPFTVVENRELCKSVEKSSRSEFRSSKLIRLRLPSESESSYRTADNLSIVVPSSEYLVERCLRLLGLKGDTLFKLIGLEENTVPFEFPVTIRSALMWHCDLASTPRRSFLRILSTLATDEREKSSLLALCQIDSDLKFREEVLNPQASIVDILERFPSAVPALDLLIQILPTIRPRPYTICSSNLVHPNTLDILVRVVNENEEEGRTYKGICSSFLSDLQIGETGLTAFTERSHFSSFLDNGMEKESSPVIMIGPGTGIAPFRAILQEFSKLRGRGQKNRETSLYFGCQHRKVDFLFEEELKGYVEEGTLDHLELAFSRDDDRNDGCGGKYVQDVLLRDRKRVLSLMLREEGVFLVCGSTRMGQAVKRTLSKILMEDAGYSSVQSQSFIKSLMARDRYIAEVWAS